jgi:hypothetical protein
VSRLLRLYPRPWRERYEHEFRELLDERPASLADRVDIIRGALDARLHPQLARGVPDRAGLGTLAGFGFLVAALLLAANGPLQYDDYGTYRDGSAAILPFIVAVGLLSFGILRLMIQLPSRSLGARTAGWVAIAAATLWSFGPWLLPVALVFFIGMLGFAIGARRVGLLSTWMVVAVAALLVAPAVVSAATMVLPWYALRESGFNFLVILGPIGGLWVLVGLRLLGGFPRPVAS